MRAQTSIVRRRTARPEARMPRALTLSVALAAIGLIAAAPASAAKERKVVKTQVKIKSVSSEIGPLGRVQYFVKGRVHSPRRGCRNDRRVQLKDQTEHVTRAGLRSVTRGRFWLGWTDRTDPPTQQQVRVKVPRSTSRSTSLADGRFICKGDRSRWFTIPPPSEAGIAAAPEQQQSLFGAGLGLGLSLGLTISTAARS